MWHTYATRGGQRILGVVMVLGQDQSGDNPSIYVFLAMEKASLREVKRFVSLGVSHASI